MATTLDRMWSAWEANYPAILGAAGGLLCLGYGPTGVGYIVAAGWKIEHIYSSVFDVAAVTTPFLFTFYAFVVTTERGFIGRAKASRNYHLTVRYTIAAMILGAAVTVLSIPMMVIEPKPLTHSDPHTYLLAAWLTLAITTFGAFVRAAYLFSIFARQHR